MRKLRRCYRSLEEKIQVNLSEEINGNKDWKVKIYAEKLAQVKQEALLVEFERLYGFSSYSRSIQTLRRRLLYKFQELQYGGLREETKARLRFIAPVP